MLETSVRKLDGPLTVSGRAELSDGRLTMAEPSFILDDVDAMLLLDDSKLIVQELTARAGSGAVSGGGTVDFTELTSPVFDLRLDADAVPLQIMDGLRAEVSGDVHLDTVAGRPRLNAELAIDRGYLTREIDGDDNSYSTHTFSPLRPDRRARAARRSRAECRHPHSAERTSRELHHAARSRR